MTRTRTADGTTVWFTTRDGEEIVTLSSRDHDEHVEAGRIYRNAEGDAGFQPVPFAPFALRPAVLRAIARHIEKGSTK